MANNLYNYGIWFNGHHSTEFGLDVLEGKKISFPSKNKAVTPIPLTNKMFDFSKVTGKNTWTERSFTIPFQVVNREYFTQEAMYSIWTRVMKWLMETHEKTPLYDDTMKNYYYMAEAQNAPNFDEFKARGIITVMFTCYPFRIATVAEGTDLWDDINFDLDYFQKRKFSVVRTTFKPVSVGQMVTVGAWSTAYEGGEKIPKDPLGNTYRIKEVQATDWGVSKRSYYLEGLNKWVVEQDIVQAQNGVTEVNLVNPGIVAVVPKITATNPISVIMGNHVFNVWKGVALSELFMLQPGENKMSITGNNPTEVEFEFYKELI